ELHRDGKLRVIAVAAAHRLGAMPDIPTAVEQGYPDLVARLFFGIFAPAKTPQPLIARIEQATQLALADPALRKNFAASGFETPSNIGAAAAVSYVASEIVRWKPIL